MILGTLNIDEKQGAVHTHRDSYLIETLSVVSVRRPFLPAGLMFGSGLTGFGLSFGDLLHPHEAIILIAAASASLLAGWQVGHLTLLSRDLRGSELSGAVWGRFACLQIVRTDIVHALAASRKVTT
ncbi:hypothetical protein [Methylobacterium marchantiae]|uniref:Uncharacterized protein n=1 Tax=Methylobacterium marchantiae TaxID=600331 RepID=A0ABW3WWK0_9HYPH|nr:hypothetical protein AIGOOFII_3143 [Methylobacterium marchantiae]